MAHTTSKERVVRLVEPRQRRSVASTENLIDAATALFVEQGYRATTVAAIGERAGLSRGAVAARFGNKEGVAWAVVRRATEQWNDVLSAGEEEGLGLDHVIEFIRTSQRSMIVNPTARLVLERLYSDSAAPLAPLHQRFSEGLADLESRVGGFIRGGIGDGSIRADIDPDTCASVLIAQLRGVGYQWFLFPGRVDPETFHELIIDQVTTWLST